MGLIKTTAGGAEILIETVDTCVPDSFAGMSDTASGFGSKTPEFMENALKSAKDVILNIAEEFKDTVKNRSLSPDEIKIGFTLSLSSTGGIWILNAGSTVSLNVELKWKKDGKHEED